MFHDKSALMLRLALTFSLNLNLLNFRICYENLTDGTGSGETVPNLSVLDAQSTRKLSEVSSRSNSKVGTDWGPLTKGISSSYKMPVRKTSGIETICIVSL